MAEGRGPGCARVDPERILPAVPGTLRPLYDALKSAIAPLTLRVRRGPLAGLRFSVACGARIASGTFEDYKTRGLLEHVRPGQTVFDVGAHVGYYTALCSKLVGPAGRVVAFEPRPVNVRLWRLHAECNGLANAALIEAAVGDREGRARFETRTGTGTGHVAAEGDLEVRMLRLDDLVARGEAPAPGFLKIDVEGGEVAVLEGARETIRAARPAMLVATHGEALHSAVTAILGANGYSWTVLDPGVAHGDVELLALPA